MRLLLDSPAVLVLPEGERHRAIVDDFLQGSPVAGNLLHNAHIAALLIGHGIERILMNDDFLRFPKLRVTNPFRR